MIKVLILTQNFVILFFSHMSPSKPNCAKSPKNFLFTNRLFSSFFCPQSLRSGENLMTRLNFSGFEEMAPKVIQCIQPMSIET